MPFYKLDSSEEPTITLDVWGAKDFRLHEGFRYKDKFDPGEEVRVESGFVTDLASVPFFLQWLVRSYGRHTMAALVHDYLWEDGQSPAELRRANRLFRHAMWELQVPWVRRWFMWAAVTLAMLARFWSGRLALAVWAVALVVAVAAPLASAGHLVTGSALGRIATIALPLAVLALVVGLVARHDGIQPLTTISGSIAGALGGVVVLAAVAALTGQVGVAVEHPKVTAGSSLLIGLAAWGRSFGAGAITTVALAVLLVPSLGVFAGLLVYEVLEIAGWALLAVGRAVKSLTHRAPAGPLNPPVTAALDSQPEN